MYPRVLSLELTFLKGSDVATSNPNDGPVVVVVVAVAAADSCCILPRI